MQQEFADKFSGRYFGKWRARVTDSTTDPKKLGRIKTICPSVLGNQELGWALPCPPTGGGVNTGQLRLPLKNDYVWIEFEEGDPSQPIWSHGPWGIRGGVSTVPRHSQGIPDSTDYSRREYGNIPPTQYGGQYGYVDYMGYRDGSFIEVDSTPGAGRVQLSHFTGTRFEMTYDGSLQEIAVQSARKHVGENHSVQVVGREEYVIGNDRKLRVGGASTVEITGDLTETFHRRFETGQTLNQTLDGNMEVLIGGSWKQRCVSQAQINVGGQLGFQCAQNIQMSASEYLELIGMNSNYTAKNAAILQGYNGAGVVQGTMVDPVAGLYISNTYLKCTPDLVPTKSSVEIGVSLSPAEIPAGAIKLTGDPLGNVLLGGDAAIQSALYGTLFNTSLTTFLLGLQVFITAVSADPLLKVMAPATSAASAVFLPIVAATYASASSNVFVSKFVKLK